MPGSCRNAQLRRCSSPAEFALSNVGGTLAYLCKEPLFAATAAPLNRELGERLRLRGQSRGKPPEQACQFYKGALLQLKHSYILWNVEQLAADDRTGINSLDHNVRGDTEFGCMIMDGEVRRHPSRILRRPRVKIVGPEA